MPGAGEEPAVVGGARRALGIPAASLTWDREALGGSRSLDSIVGVPIRYWKSKSTLGVDVKDFLSPPPPERRCVSPHLKAAVGPLNYICTF